MKLAALILSAFLYGLFCNGNVHCVDSQGGNAGIAVESEGQDQDNNNPDCNTFGILPSRTSGCSGENNNVTPSVRSTNSSRRVQSSVKDPSRVIRDGKVIDRHNFHTFQTDLKQFPSGIHSTDRYIHSLCQLLI